MTGTVSWESSSDADGYRLELLGGAGWHTSGNGLGDLGNVLTSSVAFNAAGMDLVGDSVAFRVRAYDSDGPGVSRWPGGNGYRVGLYDRRVQHSIYLLTDSATPTNPGGTEAVPDDWSASELCPTSGMEYVDCLTVAPENGEWPAWDTVDPVLFDEWTEVQHWQLSADKNTAPATAAAAHGARRGSSGRWKVTSPGVPVARCWMQDSVRCQESVSPFGVPTET